MVGGTVVDGPVVVGCGLLVVLVDDEVVVAGAVVVVDDIDVDEVVEGVETTVEEVVDVVPPLGVFS